jgi:hypothetical protein
MEEENDLWVTLEESFAIGALRFGMAKDKIVFL